MSRIHGNDVPSVSGLETPRAFRWQGKGEIPRPTGEQGRHQNIKYVQDIGKTVKTSKSLANGILGFRYFQCICSLFPAYSQCVIRVSWYCQSIRRGIVSLVGEHRLYEVIALTSRRDGQFRTWADPGATCKLAWLESPGEALSANDCPASQFGFVAKP